MVTPHVSATKHVLGSTTQYVAQITKRIPTHVLWIARLVKGKNTFEYNTEGNAVSFSCHKLPKPEYYLQLVEYYLHWTTTFEIVQVVQAQLQVVHV
jgi:hypothetical protein